MSGAALLTTESLGPSRQYDGFRDAVSATHLAWDLPRRSESRFRARIRHQRLGEADLIHCVCDPCHGRRGRPEIARTAEAAYGLLYIVGGRERVIQDGREATLRAGSFALWDSQRAIDFLVPDGLQKITLMLPQRMLDAVLPHARDLAGMPVSARSGSGALFAAHLRSLVRQGGELPAAQHDAVLHATVELMATALDAIVASAGADHRRRLMARISGHILKNLADPALTPESVAAAAGISPRQLHRVFGASGWTVERWIWRQRLLRCRQALDLKEKTPISQIAFRWGFSDAAHFSRAFREAFGASPKEYRDRGAR
ncbi:MAG TPA: helix-turn-helix domain-containing protein [Dongiaceae bacterium]|jgi:AraC-like DNA-binding protein|nr:helix-turn-helix domain-containing protein [Dongiaceae bacterium]